MSFHCYTIDGYGINISDCIGAVQPKRFVETLREYAPVIMRHVEDYLSRLEGDANPNAQREAGEILEEVSTLSNEDLVNLFEEYEADDYSLCGLSAVIAQAMSEDEGFMFALASNFDDDQFILIEPAYPWYNGNIRYSQLTKEEADGIFVKWVSALCGPNTTATIDYHSVENGG